MSTRPLNNTLIDEAAEQGIEIDIESFIETEAIQSIEVQQEIEQVLLRSATIVFTSMNAVEAVAEYMNEEMPDWIIYCIGETTQQLVKNYFGKKAIAGTADNAAELAELIAEEGYADEVIFFCGDQRRDELPDILLSNDIQLTEIMVYHTIATPKKLRKTYNGILFFSPSAVNSFFSVNKIENLTALFAIGNTTAGAIKKHTTAGVIVSDRPGKENLIEKAINYFVNNER
ncbi:MAG: uroporphyrinogen-III synthase [Bacteroidota bacterium]